VTAGAPEPIVEAAAARNTCSVSGGPRGDWHSGGNAIDQACESLDLSDDSGDLIPSEQIGEWGHGAGRETLRHDTTQVIVGGWRVAGG
jgi:hypothetical protein